MQVVAALLKQDWFKVLVGTIRSLLNPQNCVVLSRSLTLSVFASFIFEQPPNLATHASQPTASNK